MSQAIPLPRAHLAPRSSGRAYMLQWNAVHSEIAQTVPLRQAFNENLAAQIARLLGLSAAVEEVVRLIREAETSGRMEQGREMRFALARAQQYAVVDTLRVELSPRYQEEPPKTYCNIYAYDVVTALGGYLPRVWWTDGAIERLRGGESLRPVYAETVRELNANMLTDWMWAYGGGFGWTPAADITSAQEAANAGWLVVLLAARANRAESGHVNIVLGETEDYRAERDEEGTVIRPLQSQAGASNFRYRPHPSRWWQASGYERGGAWLYGGAPDSPLIPTEQLLAGGGGVGMGVIAPQPRPPRPPSRPRPAAQPTPGAAEGPFPGIPLGPGYFYDGSGSAAYAAERAAEAAERYARQGDLARAQACRAYLRVAQMAGWPSAVDTSGDDLLVWGPGFAEGGALPWVWRRLDDRVKAYLAVHPAAAAYFGGDAANITGEIRRDAAALNALVHVSEREPYRAHVVDAQLEAWMERVVGLDREAAGGGAAARADLRALSLAADLAQWTPALFRLPQALEEAEALAAGGLAADGRAEPPDPLVLAAAIMALHARRLLADAPYAEAGPRQRRVFVPGSLGAWSPMARYQRGLRELFEAHRAPLVVPSRATALIPSFQQGAPPFFVAAAELDNLPRNRLVMVHEGRYYDFGPRPAQRTEV